MNDNIFISVVICTYNRAKLLSLALKSLAEQSQDKNFFEIIVVDNNSQDNTKIVVDEWIKKNDINIKYVFEKKRGKSHALNSGVEMSKGKYIAFLDDDAKAEKNWLKGACDLIGKNDLDIFGGPIIPYYKNKKPEWFLDRYETRSFSNKKGYLDNKFLAGSNMFFKKNIFFDVGLFNVDLGPRGDDFSLAEDTEMQLRAKKKGFKIYYDPDIFVYHIVPTYKMNIKYILKRKYMNGRVARLIYGSLRYGIFSEFIFLIREFILFIFLFLGYFFRDKKRYPYWQNYFLFIAERIVVRFGRIYSYFK